MEDRKYRIGQRIRTIKNLYGGLIIITNERHSEHGIINKFYYCMGNGIWVHSELLADIIKRIDTDNKEEQNA